MHIFGTISLIASFLSITLGAFILAKNQGNPKNRSYFYLALVTGLLSFFEYKLRTSISYDDAFIWYKVMAIWPFVISFSLMFIRNYTESKPSLFFKLFCPFVYLGAVAFFGLFLFTNNMSTGLTEVSWGWKTNIKPGLLTTASSIWAVFISFTTIYLAIKYYLSNNDIIIRKQALLVTIGFSIFIIVSILNYTLVPLFNLTVPELNTTSCIIGYMFIGHAMYRYKLFNLNPASVTDEIIENINGSLVLTNAKGNIIFNNSFTGKLFGITKEKLSGLHIGKLLNREESEFKIEKQEHIIHYIEKYKNETGLKDEKKLSVSRICIQDQFNQIQGYIYLVNDITELDELKKDKSQVEFAERSKAHFIQSLYDELSTSLSNLLKLTETMAVSDTSDEKHKQLETIIRQSGLLYKYIEKLQFIISIDNNQVHLNENQHSLNNLIDEVSYSISEYLQNEKKELQIISIKPRNNEKSILDFDKELTLLMLKILSEIAIEYTSGGMIKIGYFIAENKKVSLYVSSSNFQAEDYNITHSLYELKTQDYTKIRNYGKPGISLAIIKKLTELTGGSISFEYNEKVFSFYIMLKTEII